MSSVKADGAPHTSFTILERKDGLHAVVLRCESKKGLIGAEEAVPETQGDEEEFSHDVCIRSEFLGAERLMIVLSATD